MKKTEEKEQKVGLKQRVQKRYEAWKKKSKQVSEYLDENPEKAGTLVAGIITIVLGLFGLVASQATKADEKCRIEDDYIGSYWVTDHPLTNQELMEVNRKMFDEQCDNLGFALEELGYLKDEKKRK